MLLYRKGEARAAKIVLALELHNPRRARRCPRRNGRQRIDDTTTDIVCSVALCSSTLLLPPFPSPPLSSTNPPHFPSTLPLVMFLLLRAMSANIRHRSNPIFLNPHPEP